MDRQAHKGLIPGSAQAVKAGERMGPGQFTLACDRACQSSYGMAPLRRRVPFGAAGPRLDSLQRPAARVSAAGPRLRAILRITSAGMEGINRKWPLQVPALPGALKLKTLGSSLSFEVRSW